MTLVEQLREAAMGAVREAGLSTAFSDGSERGAAQASGKFPPSTAEDNGGKKTTPTDPGNEGNTWTDSRGTPGGQGRPAFSTGNPAPSEYLSGYNASDGGSGPGTISPPSEHVSDDRSNYRTPGPPDHVRQSIGEQLIEALGFGPRYPALRCATCDHMVGMHPGRSTCLYCGAKGSQHTFTENQDLSPSIPYPEMQLVGLRLPNPPDYASEEGVREAFFGTVREAHYRMFNETERALILLDEFIEASHVFGPHGDEEGPNVTRRQLDAARDRAETYGAHSVAAHRASLSAYMSGNKADHAVAAAAHDLACGAACKAGEDYPDGNHVGHSFRMADAYHRLQSRAHHAAAGAIRVGRGAGLQSGSNFPP